MTAPFLLPSNALAAATRLRAYEPRFRRSVAKPAPVAVPAGFRARSALGNFPGTLRTDPSRVTWHGRTGSHAFEVVSADAVLTGPVVLVAKRYGADARAQIIAVEAFEPENAARLAAWVERAAAAGIELQAHRAAMDGNSDDEDGGDAEPSLGAPEGHASQVVWLRGGDRDLELDRQENRP